MNKPRRVIIVTDGDDHARFAIESIAKRIGGRCISMSGGNPSALTGAELVKLIKSAQQDPVLVMFDDSGFIGEGIGEMALRYVVTHPDIDVLGAIAVASKTKNAEWTRVHVCVDRDGELTPYGVDKYGYQEHEIGRLYGDTVYCLDKLDIPLIIGVGDVGKMMNRDDYVIGSPITKKAVDLILERSDQYNNETN